MTRPPSTRRILWLLFAVLALGLAGAWASRQIGRPAAELRTDAAWFTVRGLDACALAILAGLATAARPLYEALGRRRLLIALGLLVGGYLACGLAPRTTRILFDEHIYMQIGQTLAHTGRAELAEYARAEYGKFEMYQPWVNKQPNGLPWLQARVFAVFGVSQAAAHHINRALIGLAAAALYLGLSLASWRLPRGAPLFAGLLFIATPQVLWWGNTAAVEPAAAAFVVLAFAAACAHARLRDAGSAHGLPSTALALAGFTAFAIYFRPESLLVFPVVTLALWVKEDRFVEDLSAWGALLLSLALAVPNLLHLWSVRTEDWGATDGRRFDLDFIRQNLASNTDYFVAGHWFPLAGTLLMLGGLGWLLWRRRSPALALLVWFALSWGIFIGFYAGGYHYGASSRFSVISAAPVAVLMGVGLAALWSATARLPWLRYGLPGVAALNLVHTAHYVPVPEREAAEAVYDIRFIERQARLLPEGCLVVSPIACAWLVEGVNAANFYAIEHMLRNELTELRNQYPGGVYLHWDYWHNAEPWRAEASAEYLVASSAELVVREASHRYQFALYRLDTPGGLARFGGNHEDHIRTGTDLDTRLRIARERAAAPTDR